MAVAFTTAGSVVYSATSPSPTHNSHSIGDMLVLAIGVKPDTVSAPTISGWTFLGTASGGAGTTGADTGPMVAHIYYREATSTTTGDNPAAITLTGLNISTSQIFAFSKGAGMAWDIAGVGAADTSTGTPFSVTMPLNPGMTVGDMLFAVGYIPTDVQTPAQFSAESVSATGMTTVTLTEFTEYDTTTGNDMGGWVGTGAVVTGTATAAPTVSATAAATNTNVAGPIYLVRLREVTPPTAKSASDTGTHSTTDASSVSTFVPPPAHVQTPALVTNDLTSTTIAQTFGSAVTVGNRIVVAVSWSAGGATNYPTIADTRGNVYTRHIDDYDTANLQGLAVYSAPVTTGGTNTVTCTFGTTTDYRRLSIHEYSGISSSNPIDTTDKNKVTSGGSTATDGVTSTASNTTTDGCLIYGARQHDQAGVPTVTAGTGFTSRTNNNEHSTEDRIQTTAGSVAATWTHSTSTGYLAQMVAFRPAAADTSTTPISGSDSGTHSTTDASSVAITTFISASDTGTHSTTDTSANASTLTRADSGTHSTTDASSNLISLDRSDTGTHSTTDSSSLFISNNVSVNDTGTHSTTETAVIASTFATSDTGTHSVADSSSLFINDTKAVSDTGTHSTTDVSTIFKMIDVVDSGTHSATDTGTVFNDRPASDSGIHSTADSASIAVFGTIDIPVSDTGTHSTSDVSSVVVIVATSDTGTHSAIDASAPNVTLSTTDSGTLSTTESSTLFITKSINDTGTHSVTDTSSNSSTLAGNDSGTHSTTESVVIASVVATSDTGTHSTAEFASNTVTFQQHDRDDTGTHSATEAVTILTSIPVSDSGTHSVNDSSATFKSFDLVDSGTHSTSETIDKNIAYSLSDSGTHSVTDTSSVFINDAKDLADTGTHSTTETRSISGTATASDTGTHSVTDASTVFKAIALSDSGTLSAADASVLFNNQPTTDSGVHTTTETSSVAIFGTVTKSASDSGTHSTTESRNLAAFTTTSDTGTTSTTESISGSGTQSRNDTGTHSVTESRSILVKLDRTDEGEHSVWDFDVHILFKTGTVVMVWTGDHFVESTLRAWNGFIFVDRAAQVWNGTDWS